MMSKIFGHHPAAAAAPAPAAAPASTPAPAASAPAAPAAAPAAAPKANVDVESLLSGMAAKAPHKLDWKYSIVDLMTLLGIDSSMVNRRALASELGYTGDMNDSATMNIWLHKQVMRKVAENGGEVPATLLD
jgi:3-oxoacyl-ACP reductase-like protein